MHPVANAGLSVTASDALVTLLSWAASLGHVTIPDNVQTALSVLITIGSAYLIHATTPKDIPNAQVPPAA